jgi:hypothetical protein
VEEAWSSPQVLSKRTEFRLFPAARKVLGERGDRTENKHLPNSTPTFNKGSMLAKKFLIIVPRRLVTRSPF